MAKVSKREKSRDSGTSRSLRFGLLIVALLLTNLGWARPQEFKIGFVGDILPDRGVKSVIQKIGVAGLFQNTQALFTETNLVCANLEAAITENKTPLIKTFRFNSPLNLGDCLAQHQIKVVSLANNHTVDYGRAGLSDTAINLNQYHVNAFGYGDNARTALAPKIIEYQGTKIAFIGAVCFPLEGYVYLPDAFDVGRWDAHIIKLQIQAAREQADLVIVSLHWGIEFSHYPTASQIEMGHFCIDQGADLVIGHHPHVLQGVEFYRQKPIFYSLGNFIFDQRYGPATESVLVKAVIAGKQIRDLAIVPVVIKECVPEIADPETAANIGTHLIKYSEPFGISGLQISIPNR